MIPSEIPAILYQHERHLQVHNPEEEERQIAWSSNVILDPVKIGKLAQHIQHRRNTDLDKWEDEIKQRFDKQVVMQYRMRAPGSLLHLGGKTAFEKEERLRLFLNRARGESGAWP